MPANSPYPTATRRPVPLNRADQNEERLRVYYNQTGHDPRSARMATPAARREQKSFVDQSIRNEREEFWRDGFHDSGIPAGSVTNRAGQTMTHDQFWREQQAQEQHRDQIGIARARHNAPMQSGYTPRSAQDFWNRIGAGGGDTRQERDRRYVQQPGLTDEERARRRKEIEARNLAEQHMQEASNQFYERQRVERRGQDAMVQAARGQGAEAAEHEAAAAASLAEAEANRPVALGGQGHGMVPDGQGGWVRSDPEPSQGPMQPGDRVQFGDRQAIWSGRGYNWADSGQPVEPQAALDFMTNPLLVSRASPEELKEMMRIAMGGGSAGDTAAGDGGELSPQDQQALEWAQANPDDPRAREIRQRLGR